MNRKLPVYNINFVYPIRSLTRGNMSVISHPQWSIDSRIGLTWLWNIYDSLMCLPINCTEAEMLTEIVLLIRPPSKSTHIIIRYIAFRALEYNTSPKYCKFPVKR